MLVWLLVQQVLHQLHLLVNLTGNVTGTAATVTGAAQTNITSVGTLTALQVDNLNINGNTLSSTAGTDLLITPLVVNRLFLMELLY